MSVSAKVTLLFVVFIDLLGQGLVFPILNSLIMEPTSPLLAKSVSDPTRHLDYGLVIGAFFIAWFLGAPYISKLSDVIGRKRAILICLAGALAGYAITIAALYVNSFLLLILGRVITGFTAGNQPIAQAAMIDASANEEERVRNMGYIITGVSFGLVGGPIIGGLLSDPNLIGVNVGLIGADAGLKLPFYAAFALVAVAIVMVLAFYREVRTETAAFTFKPAEIFELLWRVKSYPLVLRLVIVLVFFQIANMTFYVFVDNYMSSRFGYGAFGGSMIMLTIGVALAFSSTFLVVPAQRRFGKQTIIAGNLIVWAVCAALFVLSPVALLCFVPVFAFYFVFGISYPTFLGLFSESVSDEEQGWVMGITIAVFTLIAGIVSLAGGDLMGINIRLPFYITIVAALTGIVVLFFSWNSPAIKRLTRKA
ncbi:MFS transporter [uncultured Roseibium sp.]|uniref:MFS transporter n=1 Tax=uncultured Roseibium sp. TaxID=1936171 RepID=UPI0032171379